MFGSELKGFYHREQIRDYMREAEHRHLPMSIPKGNRQKSGMALAMVVGLLAVLWSVANFGQIVALWQWIK